MINSLLRFLLFSFTPCECHLVFLHVLVSLHLVAFIFFHLCFDNMIDSHLHVYTRLWQLLLVLLILPCLDELVLSLVFFLACFTVPLLPVFLLNRLDRVILARAQNLLSLAECLLDLSLAIEWCLQTFLWPFVTILWLLLLQFLLHESPLEQTLLPLLDQSWFILLDPCKCLLVLHTRLQLPLFLSLHDYIRLMLKYFLQTPTFLHFAFLLCLSHRHLTMQSLHFFILFGPYLLKTALD